MHSYYKAKFNYVPTEEDFLKSKAFAKAVVPSTKQTYQDRAPDSKVDERSVLSDHFNSKVSEIAAYHFLKANGFNTTKPDFNVYEAKDKSFKPDLYASLPDFPEEEYGIHVKTQTWSMMLWTYETPSFAFTNKDKVINNPKKTDLLLLTLTQLDRSVDIIALIPAKYVLPRFIKPLKKPSEFRRAIYLKDIENAIDAGTFYV